MTRKKEESNESLDKASREKEYQEFMENHWEEREEDFDKFISEINDLVDD